MRKQFGTVHQPEGPGTTPHLEYAGKLSPFASKLPRNLISAKLRAAASQRNVCAASPLMVVRPHDGSIKHFNDTFPRSPHEAPHLLVALGWAFAFCVPTPTEGG